jgi:hypothetical protein
LSKIAENCDHNINSCLFTVSSFCRIGYVWASHICEDYKRTSVLGILFWLTEQDLSRTT